MDDDERLRLRGLIWDAINDYAEACGGDPSKYVYGNLARQYAVAKVERVLRDIEAQATGCTWPKCRCENRGLAQAQASANGGER